MGHPIGRATISELETGRRKTITVAELTVLAAALNVPPILLLTPGLPDLDVEMLPGVTVPAYVTDQWICGTSSLTRVFGDDPGTEVRRRDELAKVRRYVRLRSELDHAHFQAKLGLGSELEGEIDRLAIEVESLRQVLASLDYIRSESADGDD